MKNLRMIVKIMKIIAIIPAKFKSLKKKYAKMKPLIYHTILSAKIKNLTAILFQIIKYFEVL